MMMNAFEVNLELILLEYYSHLWLIGLWNEFLEIFHRYFQSFEITHIEIISKFH